MSIRSRVELRKIKLFFEMLNNAKVVSEQREVIRGWKK